MASDRKISVLIPLYKGRKSIRGCIESVLAQTGVSIELLLLDNGCPDDTGEWAGYFLAQQENKIDWKLLEEPENIGFAAGMNRLYGESSADYICFLNQDVELSADHLSILLDALERNPGWAGVCGTLYRLKDEKTKIIDTTGHEIFRDRIVRNRGAGKSLASNEKPAWEAGEVFGISAACALYRRTALESAGEKEGPFDPDFFSYFEDIDLDYRLRRAGWELGYEPSAEGTHLLAGSGGRRELKIRLRAYGNRRRIMWKHESWGSLLPDLGPIIMQDIYGYLRAFVTDPVALLAGPWIFYSGLVKVLIRRKRLDILLGTDRKWIKKWLKSESERIRGR